MGMAAALGSPGKSSTPVSPVAEAPRSPANRRTVNVSNPALLAALRNGTMRGTDVEAELNALENGNGTPGSGSRDPLVSEFSRNRAGSISVATATQKARAPAVRAPHPFQHSLSVVVPGASATVSDTASSTQRRQMQSMGPAEASKMQRLMLKQMEDEERQRKSPRKSSAGDSVGGMSPSKSMSAISDPISPRAGDTASSEETTPRKKKGFFRAKKGAGGEDTPKSASAPSTPVAPELIKGKSSKDLKKEKEKEKEKTKRAAKDAKEKEKEKAKEKKKEKSSSKSKLKYNTMTADQAAAVSPRSSGTDASAAAEPDSPKKSGSKASISKEDKKKKRSTMSVPAENKVTLSEALPATVAAANAPANVQRRSLVEPIYTESINLEAITDATCKVVGALCHPSFGTPKFELAILFDAVKAFSAVLKQMLSVIEGYATTFEDRRKAETLLAVADEMKASNTRELFEGIKAMTAAATEVEPLRKAVRNIVLNVWRLYCASEATQVDDLVTSMQTSVVTTRNLLTGAGDATPEELSMLADLTVIGALRVSSLVQEHTFSTARNCQVQRSLHDSGFLQAQAVRGLVLAATDYNRLRITAAAAGQATSPALEVANNNMTALLKKVAEQVRAISKLLADESPSAPAEPLADAFCATLFNRGVGLISNARDKYFNRSASTHIAEDEKHLLDVATEQAQLFKDLAFAFARGDGASMMNIAISTAENVVKVSNTIQPFLEHTMDQFVREQCLLGIESSIRCDIQLKVLLSAAALKINDVEGLDIYVAAHIVQLWGVYWTFLLDSVWRAAQMPM